MLGENRCVGLCSALGRKGRRPGEGVRDLGIRRCRRKSQMVGASDRVVEQRSDAFVEGCALLAEIRVAGRREQRMVKRKISPWRSRT